MVTSRRTSWRRNMPPEIENNMIVKIQEGLTIRTETRKQKVVFVLHRENRTSGLSRGARRAILETARIVFAQSASSFGACTVCFLLCTILCPSFFSHQFKSPSLFSFFLCSCHGWLLHGVRYQSEFWPRPLVNVRSARFCRGIWDTTNGGWRAVHPASESEASMYRRKSGT